MWLALQKNLTYITLSVFRALWPIYSQIISMIYLSHIKTVCRNVSVNNKLTFKQVIMKKFTFYYTNSLPAPYYLRMSHLWLSLQHFFCPYFFPKRYKHQFLYCHMLVIYQGGSLYKVCNLLVLLFSLKYLFWKKMWFTLHFDPYWLICELPCLVFWKKYSVNEIMWLILLKIMRAVLLSSLRHFINMSFDTVRVH